MPKRTQQRYVVRHIRTGYDVLDRKKSMRACGPFEAELVAEWHAWKLNKTKGAR